MSTTLINSEQRSSKWERASALRDYLAKVARAGDISRQTADQAWEAWRFLSQAMSNRLPVPDTAPGRMARCC